MANGDQFHFGMDTLDVQGVLQELEQGIGCGDILPQKLVRSTERAQGDFEIKTVTITYAEKKA